MRTVHVNLGSRSYDILIGPRLLVEAPDRLREYGVQNRIFLVCNTTLLHLFGAQLVERLNNNGFQVTEILIPDGEKHKNLEAVENIYTYLIAQGADRKSALVALGGGVTGDITGFVAATFLRGIPYIQIPTTLLSQVDSSVGGKTGVNHHLGKNMIGAFYQPHLVYVDLDTLSTLPPREFQSGLYEVVKYGLIYDPEFFAFVTGSLEAVRQRRADVLEEIISRCCEIKAEITSRDEREVDLRRILNFGHTFGHALEAASEFRGLTHGEAVAYGMMAALRLSVLRVGLDASEAAGILESLGRIGQLPPIEAVPTETILEALKRDKKRQGGRNVFVLLKSPGRPTVVDDLPEMLLKEVWEGVRQVSIGRP